MDDPGAVRGVERASDLLRDLHGGLDRERTPRQPVCERLPFEVLQYQKFDAVLVANVMKDADMRMLQRCDGFGFPLEAGPAVGIGSREDFDGDRAIEPRIARAIDLAEAADAEQRDDFVGADAHRFGVA